MLDNDARHDRDVRLEAFKWLTELVDRHGLVVPRVELATGFDFRGRRTPLVGPQGIFKPAVMDLPLSITTAPSGPYDDGFGPDGLLRYRYRGTDPRHRDNVGLRTCMRHQLPLIYCHGIAPGAYAVTWPVFVVGDDLSALAFKVAVDDAKGVDDAERGLPTEAQGIEARRRYVTAVVRRRLHQEAFRSRVLRAYQQRCALCNLRHAELLDAAHIVGDAEEGGEPVVPNGIALCKIHHAAFDRFFIGIDPDLRVAVREDLLREVDGPMLRHGLQELHGARMRRPRSNADQPDRERLERRWETFRTKVEVR